MEPETCLLLVRRNAASYTGGVFSSPTAAVRTARGLLSDGARAAMLFGPTRRLIWCAVRTVR